MKLNLQGVLKNKYLLYAVSALAVINVLGYLSIGSMECLGVFALTALVCQQYQKNMTICLLAAIFAANVVFGCGRIKENLENPTIGTGGGGPDQQQEKEQAVTTAVESVVKACKLAENATGDAATCTAAADEAACEAIDASKNCAWRT